MALTEELENLIKITKTPSYLKYLLREPGETILLCAPKPKSVNANGTLIDSITANDTVLTDFELTGNPLALDLSKEDSVCSDIINPTNWWLPEESKHYPMSIQVARKYINTLYKNKRKDDSGDSVKRLFCLCNGKDTAHTVIIGSYVTSKFFSRTLVYDRGYFSSCDEELKVESMRTKHIDNGNFSVSKVECNVSGLYSIFGHNLSNTPVSEFSDDIGSILIDAQWKSFEWNIPQYKSELKLKLQLITGHCLSLMQNYWNHLRILHHLLESRLRNDLSSLEYNSDLIDYKTFTELTNSINILFGELNLERRCSLKDKRTMTLNSLITNLNEVNDESLFDKLWKLLVCCRNVSDLKDSFSKIFEEIAQNTWRLHIPENDSTNIANIITGLYNGKIAVPNINEIQALELLIELGIEKLKNDYIFIIDFFDFIPRDAFIEKWNEGISPKSTDAGSDLKKSLFRPTLEHLRATRTTICSQSALINLQECVLKINKLAQLHVSLEFLCLMEKFSSLNKPVCFHSLCGDVFEKCFGTKSCVSSVTTLKENPLCEISIPVNYDDLKLDEINTLMWRIEMKSTDKNCELKTIFLLSDSPVLPPTVSDNDFHEILDDSKMFSVLELVTYTQHN